MLGRCKVRVVGVHSQDKEKLPTEDLPWASPLQPVTQAGSSGVGKQPMGLLEGSCVAIIFTDEDKQIPIILGAIAGFVGQSNAQKAAQTTTDTSQNTSATPPVPTNSAGFVTDSDGGVLLDGSGNPVKSGEFITSADGEIIKIGDSVPLFDPSSLQTSAAGKEDLKKHESLSSSKAGSNSPTTLSRLIRDNGGDLSKAIIYAYKDQIGHAIGYGSRFLADGTTVTASTKMQYVEAATLFERKLKDEFEAGVKRNLKVKVTQSMFDSLVQLAYNAGVSGLVSHSLFSSLNAGAYRVAANAILTFKTNNGLLSNRRRGEYNLFIRDGLPETAEELAKPPTDTSPPDNVNPATKADGTSTIKYTDESDVSRLSRNSKFKQTDREKDVSSRTKNVAAADGTFWSQPNIGYGAVYPMNHVYTSESGHMQEFDDTPGYERISLRHKTGTFIEVDSNGTQVNKIVGDSYTIIDRHGFISISGNCNITVTGNANLNVQNNATVSVSGNIIASAGGNVDVAANGKMQIGSNGDLSIHQGGIIALDAQEIHLNSGKAVKPTYKSTNPAGDPTFTPLVALQSGSSEINSTYEQPDEGDNETYIEKNQASLDIGDMTEVKGVEKESLTPPAPAGSPINSQCETLLDSQITSSYRLSPNVTLGRLLSLGSSGYPSGKNYGLTASEIVCNLKLLQINCLEPIIAEYPSVIVTSAWRSEKVNKRIGGSNTSDHLFGRAIDIQIPRASRAEYLQIANKIAGVVKDYRQIILEYKGQSTWIHISYKVGDNKKQILTMDASRNKTIASGKFVRLG